MVALAMDTDAAGTHTYPGRKNVFATLRQAALQEHEQAALQEHEQE